MQRGQLFQVSEVRAETKPVMFKIKDLMNDNVSGQFYEQQLTKSPPPKPDNYFFVEKILGQKKIKGVKHYLVKYLYYPNKFNRYIPESNFKKKK